MTITHYKIVYNGRSPWIEVNIPIQDKSALEAKRKALQMKFKCKAIYFIYKD